MDFTRIVSFFVVLLSLWAVVASLSLLVRVVREGYRCRFFAVMQGYPCDGCARRGVSLLCRDVGGVERLRNLLAVEYPDYEVVVVADSQRNPTSLQRIVAEYRMVVVDARPMERGQMLCVRRMYRSANRCYRRLLLLDVATTGERADLDAAFEVASYDYLLPLWGEERLLSGAVERLMVEVDAQPASDETIIATCVGAPLRLVARSVVGGTEGFAAAVDRLCESHILYEPLAFDPMRRVCKERVAVAGLAVLIVGVSIAAVMAEESALVLGIVALTLLLIMAASYAAKVVIAQYGRGAVEYVAVLSLFYKNIFPHIWKIGK